MGHFDRVLIANRGEIALRIIRALKTLEIESVAIYSDPDVAAMHVTEADKAYPLHGIYSTETYLNMEKIIEIARKSESDAIHPGYGFISENAKFAKMCEENSIKFIGPTSKTLEVSGDKLSCKILAEKNRVPIIPASEEPVQDPEEAAKRAQDLGYPVLLKTAFGGGGRGIKEAKSRQEIKDAFESSQREAKGAFGRFSAFIEKKLVKPRHIEIQIIASDDSGEVIHLGERECSVQRRYQKLVELSPSPVMDEDTREKVAGYAIKVAKAVKYSNACTIEFLRDSETENYYFLEVNSRLQVEHPVTESITGVDIVASQILVASENKLPIRQNDVSFHGAAIECRINAEDALSDFAPSSGKIEYLHVPGGPGIRVDRALYEGLEVTPYYDSLLAKVISWGQDFNEARKRMVVALDEFRIAGVETTIPFHRKVVQNRLFSSGNLNTSFIDDSKVMNDLQSEGVALSEDSYAIAALLLKKNQFSEGGRPTSQARNQNNHPRQLNGLTGGRFVEPL
jgi:acetyl-CoA/propionyl-CoA carboxylase